MSILVLIVGIINVLTGLLGLTSPALLRKFVTKFWRAKQGYLSALIFRLSFSAMLILGARSCKFSTFILILGIFSALTAIAILFVSQEKQTRLREWTLSRPDRAVRRESILGLFLGGLFIYAAL